jgi:polysaccharide deacetylase 2 family uncharacterized protein YibQ
MDWVKAFGRIMRQPHILIPVLLVTAILAGFLIGRTSTPVEAVSAHFVEPVVDKPQSPEVTAPPGAETLPAMAPGETGQKPTEVKVDEPAAAALAPPVSAPPVNPAWQKHGHPMPNLGGLPVIALIIDDIGPDRRESARALDLPSTVTLSLLPYAENIAKTAARARGLGHEIMIHLPMEPIGSEDPGPGALKTDMSPEDMSATLDKTFDAFEGPVALNNHMGSKATQDPALMHAVLQALKARGLFFIDSMTTGKSIGLQIAAEEQVTALARDIFIDDDPSPIAIERQLTATETFARKHGAVIAIAHPRAGSLDLIERWLAEVQRRGVVLVPVSELARRKAKIAQAATPGP